VVDIAACDATNSNQAFTFVGDASGGSTTTGSAVVATPPSGSRGTVATSILALTTAGPSVAAAQPNLAVPVPATTCTRSTRTKTVRAASSKTKVAAEKAIVL
jgi:hypothetical protein